MTGRRLGLIAGAALLFAGLTAIFMVVLRPLAEEQPAKSVAAAPACSVCDESTTTQKSLSDSTRSRRM